MSWCDKLASVPTVGIKIDPYYGGRATILTNLAPLISKWGEPEKPEFAVQMRDVHSLNIQREDGYLYGFEANRMSVQFQHRMQFRPTSGGLPTAELISSQNSFTSLLDEAIKRLIEVAVLLPEAGARRVQRIGVISTTSVSEEDLPPGIARYIDYVGRPWRGNLVDYDFSINSKLEENDTNTIRCIHQVKKPEDPESLMTLKLDWQKMFEKPIPVTKHELNRHCEIVKGSALEYFEELAVGDLFDANA